MKPTSYPNINKLLHELLSKMRLILGEKMVGLYLTGSLIWGDFDERVSDIDLVVALFSKIDDKEFGALRNLHQDFAEKYKEWNDRIDVCYISVKDINTTEYRNSELVKISSGEPLNRKESNKERLVHRYLTREKSMTLFGPDPKTIIDPISKEEFIESVKTHAQNWNEYVKETKDSRTSQAYAILTMCRAIYTITNGEQVSKRQAAIWSAKKFPEWRSLINKALLWRHEYLTKEIDGRVTYPETVEFVNFIRSQILK